MPYVDRFAFGPFSFQGQIIVLCVLFNADLQIKPLSNHFPD